MFDYKNLLNNTDLQRYSRHLVLEQFNGPEGQLKIKSTQIGIVGGGGLANVAAGYLTCLGFGNITIIDDDIIELSNLNRQIMFNSMEVGHSKCEILTSKLKNLNPDIDIKCINKHLTYDNSASILNGFDIVLDCTDNPYSRYCINDTCIKLSIPVVFGSALRWEGQLSVYGYKDGPCLRCIFPKPLNPEFVGRCDDQGVIGPIVGIIGSMQALECLKITLGIDGVLYSKMFIFNGLNFKCKTINLRNRSQNCPTCNKNIELSQLEFPESSCIQQYSILKPENMLSVEKYKEILLSKSPHTLIDVRVESQYNCARFDHAIHIPLEQLIHLNLNEIISRISLNSSSENIKTICFICRRGRKSRDAVDYITKLIKDSKDVCPIINVYNITGGFMEWTNSADHKFPYF